MESYVSSIVSGDQNLLIRDSLPTATSMTANQSQIFSQALDYYLGDGAQYIPHLSKLAQANTKEADELILR
jgi:hypothetical protein